MANFKVYIVEDDPFYGRLLKHHLSMNPDHDVELFTDGKSCLEQIHKKPNVVCMDYGLPDVSGDELFRKIQKTDNSIPVIIISSQEEVSVAVNLLKLGARDYIVKDDNAKDLLWRAIIKIQENNSLKQEVETLKAQLGEKYSFDTIIGKSKAMQQVFSLLQKAIKSNINVSITGETGSGKEVIAKAIHFNSNRSKLPFIAVNMAAIPKDLLESELFGHEKGAFTGAIARKIGKFEAAGEGTLFLDEIAEMELSLQGKILRALQEREFTRVGGTQSVAFNARLVTATHRDLELYTKEGKFREDLYYRIIGLPIHLPPLREREEDIIILAEYFVEVYAKENKIKLPVLNKSAKDKLLKYNFPGNVRELKSIIDLACVMCENGRIKDEDIIFSGINNNTAIYSHEEKTLDEYNEEIILHFLEKYNNNVMEVARRLDIGKSTIYNMLKNKK